MERKKKKKRMAVGCLYVNSPVKFPFVFGLFILIGYRKRGKVRKGIYVHITNVEHEYLILLRHRTKKSD